ncbi:MAG TPA: outer membrane lipoprotein carrier protein LolA [Stellaceae bacterium]|nr:outer membrane lipoprotein carrier protein LolA [Stellaceae bacterium]
MTRRAALAGLAAALAAAASRARAAVPQAAPLDEAAYQEVLRVQAYLNGIRTMQSRFEQVADNGGVAQGTIYLDRPGRMRIVYDPPSTILIVATGGQVYYYDRNLQQVTRTTVNDTPAWFLLRDRITLGGEVTLTHYARAADTVRVTLVETDNVDLGQVTLVLSEQPLALRQWIILDAQKKQVTVTLQDPQFGVALNPNLFYWTDPRG